MDRNLGIGKSWIINQTIRKFDDDWWIVEDQLATIEFNRHHVEDECFYKCDSIDGVHEYFKDLFEYLDRPKHNLIDRFKDYIKR
jgi:hypothetical protein